MFCTNCGKSLNNNESFCSNCGQKNNINIDYNQNNNLSNNSVNMNYDQNNNDNEKILKKYKISKVIGYITISLVFVIQVLVMPLSIVGIVFGASSFKKNSKYKLGLILNIISLVIAIPIFLIYSYIFDIPKNPIVGTWNCKSYNNGYYEELDYIVTMEISNNDKFMWAKYNDEDNNYVVGNYEIEKLDKYHKEATFYNIKLTGKTYVSDGDVQTEKYKSEYEIGLENNENESVMINPYTYQMYYCRKVNSSNPKIKKY